MIYKNNKPYFKFTLPPLPVSALEKDVWRRFYEEANPDFQKGLEDLKTVPFNALSPMSQHLLSLKEQSLVEFIAKHVGVEPVRNSVITCTATINRSSPDQQAAACPVVGTEAGHVYVLDPQSFTIIHQVSQKLCDGG